MFKKYVFILSSEFRGSVRILSKELERDTIYICYLIAMKIK